MGEEERVAHGNQLPCALGSSDSGDAGYLQRIALRVLGQLFKHTGPDAHESMGRSGPARLRLGGYVHHLGSALFVVMRERTVRGFLHLMSTRMSSPPDQLSRSASATRNALARVRATTSPEPCQDSGVIVA